MELMRAAPHARTWRDGEKVYEQRRELAMRRITVEVETPDFILEHAQMMVKEQVLDYANTMTDEPLTEVTVYPWEEYTPTDEHGNLLPPVLTCTAEVGFWPRMPESL